MRIELLLLPLALLAFLACARKALKKFPAGNAAIIVGGAVSTLALAAVMLLVLLRQG